MIRDPVRDRRAYSASRCLPEFESSSATTGLQYGSLDRVAAARRQADSRSWSENVSQPLGIGPTRRRSAPESNVSQPARRSALTADGAAGCVLQTRHSTPRESRNTRIMGRRATAGTGQEAYG